MKVYDNIEDFIQQLTNYDTVALSAPLLIPEDSSMIIGYYSPAKEKGVFTCIIAQQILGRTCTPADISSRSTWAQAYTGAAPAQRFGCTT